jgi:hypothetical protein
VAIEGLFFIAIFWVLPIFVGKSIGDRKGRAGWAWGLLLGWIGVTIVACLSDRREHAYQLQAVRAAAALPQAQQARLVLTARRRCSQPRRSAASAATASTRAR